MIEDGPVHSAAYLQHVPAFFSYLHEVTIDAFSSGGNVSVERDRALLVIFAHPTASRAAVLAHILRPVVRNERLQSFVVGRPSRLRVEMQNATKW